jgi:uncharacterized membrane protein YbhN (UPF0104 family)
LDALLRAIESFFEQLTAISWAPLGLAVLFHLGRIVARTRAWRNIVAAAYPDRKVRWRGVFGAYSAGIGANALVPGRGGDLLRLFLVRRRVDDSTYPTLGATLLAEAVFDAVVGSILIVIALATGVLPGLGVVSSRLPAIDWLWLFHNPGPGLAILFFALVAALLGGAFASRRIADFWRRVRQGLAILRNRPRYLRRVASWQAVDWACRVAGIVFFLRAFGLPITAENVFVVQVTQSLSTLLPLTPAGIGTEQALLVYLFTGEAASSDVLSFSVGVKLVTMAVNVALGSAATLLMLRSLRWRHALGRDAAELR